MDCLADLRRRSAPRAALRVAILVVGLLGGGRAEAQSVEAEALFNDGNRLMAEGKLAEACEALEASNRVEPRAGTLLLLGRCRERNQQLASAWSAYRAALARAKNPSYRALAQAGTTALEPRLSYLTVQVNDERGSDGLTVTRNGKLFDSMLWNRALPVDGGDYVIAGHAPGHEEWQTTVHVPIEGARVRVDVPTLAERNTPIARPAPARQPTVLAQPRDPAAARPEGIQGAPGAPRASRRVVPLVVGVGALMLVGGGVGFERWAESRYAEAKAETENQSHRDALYDSANTRRHVAEALAVSGLVAGGVAVWLYLRDRNRAHGATLGTRVQVAPAGAGLAVSGQF